MRFQKKLQKGTLGFSSTKFTKVYTMETTKAAPSQAANTSDSLAGGTELNGSDILVKALQAENVKYLWGYPGGAVLHIYDALYKQDTIQHILVRHEQAAVHAADGYARATGDVGVALVTSGPGVTNAVTGIATAYMDSIPMVIITGQVPTHAIGLDAFQECDTVGITAPSSNTISWSKMCATWSM
jgi:acetolactate synthase-1/2/3 large subunit